MFKKYSILILFLFFLNIDTFAQNRTVFPRLEPDPVALQYHNLRQDYSWLDLAKISLWASTGNSVNENDPVLRRITELCDTIKNAPDFPTTKTEQADYILTYLHRNVLRTYTLLQSRVDNIFSTGRYNCVSSAVLYTIICKSLDIETAGVVTREHAFVVVYADSRSIDVETTNRYGFDPGNRREFQDQFGRITGFAYVPPQNYRDRQTISQIELVSLVLYNRIVDHERQSRFADPVPLAIDRAALLLGATLRPSAAAQPDSAGNDLFKEPYKELLNSIFIYSGMLIRNNLEEDAIRWAVAASAKFPESVRWQEVYFTSVNNRTIRYIRANQVTEARAFLENNKHYLSDDNYNRINISITDAELLRRATGITTLAESETAITAIEQARSRNLLNEERANELRNFAIQKTVSILASPSGGNAASGNTGANLRRAIQYLETAIARYGQARELEQALRNYRNALASDYHNRFAAEWNRQNFAEAERILNEGLLEFPDNRQLLNDKAIADRQRNR